MAAATVPNGVRTRSGLWTRGSRGSITVERGRTKRSNGIKGTVATPLIAFTCRHAQKSPSGYGVPLRFQRPAHRRVLVVRQMTQGPRPVVCVLVVWCVWWCRKASSPADRQSNLRSLLHNNVHNIHNNIHNNTYVN